MRLIDADAFKEHMDYVCNAGGWMQPVTSAVIEYVKKNIDAEKTVDAVEVVHAKLLNPNPYGLCSNCNYLIDIRDGFNYCPKCGAMLKTDEVTK